MPDVFKEYDRRPVSLLYEVLFCMLLKLKYFDLPATEEVKFILYSIEINTEIKHQSSSVYCI